MKGLSKETLEELKKQIKQGKFILFFTADWCADCRFIKPAMPEIEKEFPEFTFLKVDRDANLPLAKKLGIMGIPSFVVYNNGIEIGRLVNKDRKTKEQVINFIKSVENKG